MDTKLDRARARSRQAAEEFQAKVTALQKRIDKAMGHSKATLDLEARLAKLPSDYQSRGFA